MKFTEIDFGGYQRAADKRARLNQLFNERALLRKQLQEQQDSKIEAKLIRLETLIDALEETMSPLAAAKARLAQLKADLADLPQNPGSQEGYDALDDLRDAIKKQEEKIATLSEAAPASGQKVRDATNDPTIAFEQARQRAVAALAQISAQIDQMTTQQLRNAHDWGYPGSMNQVASQLEELRHFLGD
jgi:DNA repair exonuclease SbcCD ATPase subunit